MPPESADLSLAQGRLYILLAAVLWSLGSLFAKLLREPTSLALNEPSLSPLQLAFYRTLFAGLVLLPTLRPGDVTLRPALLWLMGLSFAVMNAMYVSALALGQAANAILLQYTAPLWMYLAAIFLLGETTDRRSTVTLYIGLAGVTIILLGGWQGGERLDIIALGLGSGITYAGVLICLRVLRTGSANWLVTWNHLFGALALLPIILTLDLPSLPQLGVLFLYGSIQMALPYFLMARGLRVVSPQEAGAITLLEPILNPIWAYLIAPETETPRSVFTYIGGALIVGGLAWRYWPRKAAGRRVAP